MTTKRPCDSYTRIKEREGTFTSVQQARMVIHRYGCTGRRVLYAGLLVISLPLSHSLVVVLILLLWVKQQLISVTNRWSNHLQLPEVPNGCSRLAGCYLNKLA